MENGEWIYSVMSAGEASRIEQRAARYEKERFEDGVSVTLKANNHSAVSLLRAWNNAMTGDIEAWMHVMQFFEALISSIADHLQEQGIDPDE
jgi:hypothetical protein